MDWCESVGKADLLSDHFDGKQSRKSVDLPHTCHPSPSVTSFAFRSSEVRHLLFDLDPYGGSDPLGMLPLILWPLSVSLMGSHWEALGHRRLPFTADVLAPRLSVAFQRLVHLGSFTICWRQANVTPIQKGPLPSSVANYQLIFITSVLSKVFEHLVSVRLR